MQVLGLALLAALGAGAVVSADSSVVDVRGYPTGPSGTTGPTGTATATPTRVPTPTPTVNPGSKPKINLILVKKKATRKRIGAKVRFSRAGKVNLKAKIGKKKVGKKTVKFKASGRKNTKIKLKKKKVKPPVRVMVIAQGRDFNGVKSKRVKKRVKIQRGR